MAVSITARESAVGRVVYAFLVPSGEMDMPRGREPVLIVAVSVLVAVEMTWTVLLLYAVTYTAVPSGATARLPGPLLGSPMTVVTARVAVSMPVTELVP